MDWGEREYVQARDCHGLPPSDGWRQTERDLLHIGPGEPTRRKEAIDRWVEQSREKIATLSRLITRPEKSSRGWRLV